MTTTNRQGFHFDWSGRQFTPKTEFSWSPITVSKEVEKFEDIWTPGKIKFNPGVELRVPWRIGRPNLNGNLVLNGYAELNAIDQRLAIGGRATFEGNIVDRFNWKVFGGLEAFQLPGGIDPTIGGVDAGVIPSLGVGFNVYNFYPNFPGLDSSLIDSDHPIVDFNFAFQGLKFEKMNFKGNFNIPWGLFIYGNVFADYTLSRHMETIPDLADPGTRTYEPVTVFKSQYADGETSFWNHNFKIGGSAFFNFGPGDIIKYAALRAGGYFQVFGDPNIPNVGEPNADGISWQASADLFIPYPKASDEDRKISYMQTGLANSMVQVHGAFTVTQHDWLGAWVNPDGGTLSDAERVGLMHRAKDSLSDPQEDREPESHREMKLRLDLKGGFWSNWFPTIDLNQLGIPLGMSFAPKLGLDLYFEGAEKLGLTNGVPYFDIGIDVNLNSIFTQFNQNSIDDFVKERRARKKGDAVAIDTDITADNLQQSRIRSEVFTDEARAKLAIAATKYDDYEVSGDSTDFDAYEAALAEAKVQVERVSGLAESSRNTFNEELMFDTSGDDDLKALVEGAEADVAKIEELEAELQKEYDLMLLRHAMDVGGVINDDSLTVVVDINDAYQASKDAALAYAMNKDQVDYTLMMSERSTMREEIQRLKGYQRDFEQLQDSYEALSDTPHADVQAQLDTLQSIDNMLQDRIDDAQALWDTLTIEIQTAIGAR